MKNLIIPFCLISSFFLNASFIEIEVTDISQEGILHLAIYNSKETFESDKGDKPGPQEGIVGGVIEFVEKGLYKRKFELPDGIYAIGLYVDSNKNEKLDTNFFGIPTEQFGFSNNAKGRFGPPSFESASFELDAFKEISINLK
tara:strand:- start:563 stop:991 length:429 start_codon:yes stop_codon:yes gene_type:complete